MKKSAKIISVILSGAVVFSMAACGQTIVGEQVDKDRTQLYVGLHQAGYGIAWFDAIKEGFEKKYPNVQVIGKPGTSVYEYNFQYNIGSMEEDVIFPGGGYNYTALVNGKKILALDDVYETEVAGKKLKDALSTSTKNYVERDGHLYGMPVVSDGYQMIFDADMWDEYGFWMDDSGKFQLEYGNAANFKKSAGQDGVEGTYDDGLPITYSQFFTLLKHIKESNCVPFTWSGKYWTIYLAQFAKSAVSYMSKTSFEKIYSTGMDGDGIELTTIDQDKISAMPAHEYGKYNMSDYMDKTSQKTIKWENFEEIQTLPGVYYALCFAQDVMDTSNGKNFTTFSVQGSESHTQAQEHFLRSVDQPNVTGGRVAMLVDGGWWENEAVATFEDMAAKIDEKYSAENRNFGIMPFPLPDDVANYPEERADMGYLCSDTTSIMLVVNAKTSKPEIAKDFLRYIYSEEGIKIMRNYKLTIPLDLDIENSSANLTPYQKIRNEVYALNNIAVTDVASSFGQYYATDIYDALLFRNMSSNPFSGSFYGSYSQARDALATLTDAAKKALNMNAKLQAWGA